MTAMRDQTADIPAGWPTRAAAFAAVLLATAGLYWMSRWNYLLYHSLVEMVAVVIGWTIFVVVWNTRRYVRDAGLTILGISFLFVAIVDLLHTLAYEGMGVLDAGGPNRATQLWIAARYLEAGGMVAAALLLRHMDRPLTVAAFTLVAGLISILLVAAVFTGIFPDSFVPGAGLTRFKVVSEYAICLVLAAAAVLFWRQRPNADRHLMNLLIVSIGLTILSELSFTLYNDVYGVMNFAGHFLKLAAFTVVYVSLIHTGLRQPYRLLYRGLREEHEQRLRLESRIAQAQKIESLGVMAGGIAHDFNNLLMAILGNVELAALQKQDPEQVRSSLDEIRTAAERANTLTRQMLAFAGRGQFIPSPTDLVDVLRRSGGDARRILPPHVDLELSLDCEGCTVAGEPTFLRQAFKSLMTNGIESIGQGGGTVTCSLEETTVAPDETLEDAAGGPVAPGTYARVDIADTGCGMDEATKARLFDPFFSTKFTGRGLGMPAVLGIVRSHKGAIFVESAPGQGTRVTVLLPVADASAPQGGHDSSAVARSGPP